jgi:anti-sigma B factor antagonist
MKNLRMRGFAGGVLYVSGELDMASIDEFEEGVRLCLDGEGEVVLDLSGLSFMDSTGVNAILSLAREVGDRSVVLRHPSRTVLKVLDIVRIDGHENVRVERAPQT